MPEDKPSAAADLKRLAHLQERIEEDRIHDSSDESYVGMTSEEYDEYYELGKKVAREWIINYWLDCDAQDLVKDLMKVLLG